MRVQVVTLVCLLAVGVTASRALRWDKKGSNNNSSNPVDEIKTMTLTKDRASDFGFKLANVKQSLLVAEVTAESPAARAGLRFGDQVLTVNDDTPMGRQLARVHEWMSARNTLVLTYKPAPYNRRIELVRRPGESDFGFEVDDDAEIEMVYSDTPAVRGGLMTDHVVLSVNGVPTGGVGRLVEDLVPKVKSPELVLEVMPSNFYFAIKKNVNFEAGNDDDDDDDEFGRFGADEHTEQVKRPTDEDDDE